ncbi:hypothetical protein G3A43_06860 [Paraburkholderia aspalathi]|nr:hypothetical protein [Paraburkholderia aspalathi]MBK3779971.1 hypothetical protein [Paraburkholderia aspalathi]
MRMTTTTAKTTLTPEQIAERVAASRAAVAEQRAAVRQRELATAADVEREGLTIAHFRRKFVSALAEGRSHTGGVTVAYRHKSTNTFVEIATAICRDDEVFSRKQGTQTAVDQFKQGRVIRVPLYGRDAVEVVQELFEGVTTSVPKLLLSAAGVVIRH